MFENHAPDTENKDALNAISLQTIGGGAELGLLFNADADKFTAVDSCGREIPTGDSSVTETVIEAAKRFREERKIEE